jgi:hypothetical protein
VLLQHRLHGFELRKVLTHVRVQDHVDAEVAELAKLRLLHVRKDVAVVLLNHSEKQKKQYYYYVFKLTLVTKYFSVHYTLSVEKGM